MLPDLSFLHYATVLGDREIEHRSRISEKIGAKVGNRFLVWIDDEYEIIKVASVL